MQEESPKHYLASKLDPDRRTAFIVERLLLFIGPTVATAARIGFVHFTERSGASWDFNNRPFNNAHPELHDFGNFHYGL